MTAQVVDIHEYLPVMLDPPPTMAEPATVIFLPIVKIERAYVRKWRSDVVDDGLPSDCQ